MAILGGKCREIIVEFSELPSNDRRRLRAAFGTRKRVRLAEANALFDFGELPSEANKPVSLTMEAVMLA
jgi:hypothetical protein